MNHDLELHTMFDNETNASSTMQTREGRKITYRLTVVQQPDKARACGSGSKSSADRRPVDPPPIIQLRIFEGETADREITFQINANYFLFASLEQTRPAADGRHDRVRTGLTGTPVAGMVYLDRPSPAGYFVFSDLSVRNEGYHRLCFNLYEEIKQPKDGDAHSDMESSLSATSHVTHRLEVRTVPFIVWIAKKFPGLATSTSLSRTIAEQGCRVRIRRDIRLRKHDKIDDWDAYPNELSHAFSPPMLLGHDTVPQRGRSTSSDPNLMQTPIKSNRPLAVKRRRSPSLARCGRMYQPASQTLPARSSDFVFTSRSPQLHFSSVGAFQKPCLRSHHSQAARPPQGSDQTNQPFPRDHYPSHLRTPSSPAQHDLAMLHRQSQAPRETGIGHDFRDLNVYIGFTNSLDSYPRDRPSGTSTTTEQGCTTSRYAPYDLPRIVKGPQHTGPGHSPSIDACEPNPRSLHNTTINQILPPLPQYCSSSLWETVKKRRLSNRFDSQLVQDSLYADTRPDVSSMHAGSDAEVLFQSHLRYRR